MMVNIQIFPVQIKVNIYKLLEKRDDNSSDNSETEVPFKDGYNTSVAEEYIVRKVKNSR